MSGSLDDTAAIESVMKALQTLLLRQYGFLPDAILVLHGPDGHFRTTFAAAENTVKSGRDLREVMTEMFLGALGQNDMLLEEALKMKLQKRRHPKRRSIR